MSTPLTQKDFDEKVYKYKKGFEQIKDEAEVGYMVESIEINKGLYTHVMGMEYPEKGLAPAQDVFNANIVKKLIIEPARLLKYFAPSILVFLVLPYKFKIKVINKILTSFNIIAYRAFSPSILQDQHLTPMAQELKQWMLRFFKELDIDQDVSRDTTELLINVLNFDNAYRYRIQDLFNETTVERIKNPRKEFKRLMLINREREAQHQVMVSNKFKLFGTLLSLIFLHPKIKKAYIKSIDGLNLIKLQPDKADWFWMCVRTGYNYFGRTDKERTMDINHLKYVIPSKINK